MNDTTELTSKPKISFAPQKILGWHFSNGTNLQYQDPRKIVLGETLSIPDDKQPIPCEYGFHCSELALDAFRYAPGFTLWRVELEGDLQSHGSPNGIVDKWVARKRKAIAGGIDVKEAISKFARDCALDVSHLWEMPAIMREFLETGNPKLAYADNAVNAAAYANAVSADNAANAYAAAIYAAAYVAYSAAYAYSVYAYAANAVYYAAMALGVDIQVYKQKFEQICSELVK